MAWMDQQAVMLETSGEVHEEITVDVPSIAGASQLTATAFIPAGVELAGIGYRVVTAFSVEQGLVWVELGGLGIAGRWGSVLGIAAGDTNHAGLWVGGRVNMATPGDVVLLPNPPGALFGAGGLAKLTCFYTVFIPL